jgi:hypothetical protein
MNAAMATAVASASSSATSERVVTPTGIAVQKYFRRTRAVDGSTFAWVGRVTTPGSGPGWSGLKFDFLRDVSGRSD